MYLCVIEVDEGVSTSGGWEVNALPARNLKGEFVNNIAVQDAFVEVASLTIMGLEAKFLRMPPTKSKIDELISNAQKKYPKKAGKTEMHHPIPKYLGGVEKQELVPLDAAYHQMITNEFRRLHGYGLPNPSPQRLQEIMKEVYSKYPLP